MTRLPRLLRGALALAAGVLLALAAAAPAAAAPVPFAVSDTGEDYCTFYEASGEAEWPDIVIQPTVAVTGKASTTVADDRPCLDVVPFPRHVQFTAYDGAGPVDAHREALPNTESGFDYAFELTADETRAIEYVTVAVCVTDDLGGQPFEDCTEPVVLKPGA